MAQRSLPLPRANACSSALLQLPAEIRIKILRLLLRKGSMITAASGRDIANNHLHLSSQLLRTCRTLYNEGRQILYEENILEILLRGNSCWYGNAGSTASLPCYFANKQVWLPDSRYMDSTMFSASLTQTIAGMRGLTSRNPDGDWPEEKDDTTYELSSMVALHPFLGTFKQYQLTCKSLDEFEIAVAARMLRDVLANKDVTVYARFTSETEYKALAGLCWLRCRSFCWNANLSKKPAEGLQGDTARNAKSKQQGLARYSKVITSSDPVFDTLDDWVTFKSFLKTRNLIKQRSMQLNFEQHHEDDLRSLEAAALSYEEDRYVKQMAHVLKLAKSWNRTLAQEETERIEKEMQWNNSTLDAQPTWNQAGLQTEEGRVEDYIVW